MTEGWYVYKHGTKDAPAHWCGRYTSAYMRSLCGQLYGMAVLIPAGELGSRFCKRCAKSALKMRDMGVIE
jgi:hypothetical protein